MRRAFAVSILLVIALVVAVGSAAADDKPQPQTWPVSAYGAGVVSADGVMSLQVPANTFTGTVTYTPKTKADYPTLTGNTMWAGDPFRLQFNWGGGDSGPVKATLTINYKPADLGGRSESTLRLVQLSSDGAVWNGLAKTIDTVNHTVSGQIVDVDGYYGILVSNVIPTAAPAPTAVPTAVPAPAPAPVVVVPAPAPVPAAPPAFKLGFATLAALIPDIAGQPLENEHYGANGDSLQQTTTGLMVWRKADNWTAFTNGSITWINGPVGLQNRPNTDRFDWEK